MTYNPVTPIDTDAVPCRRDPERMFPTGIQNTRKAQEASARAVCRTGNGGRACPLIDRCLRYALRHNVDGVWAATTLDERVAIRERTGVVAIPLVLSPALRAAS